MQKELTITNRQLITYFNLLHDLKQKVEEKESKYFVDKNIADLEYAVTDFNDAEYEMRIDAAKTDEDGALLKDDKGDFKFTPEGTKRFSKERKELLNKKVKVKITVLPNNSEIKELKYDYYLLQDFFPAFKDDPKIVDDEKTSKS